MNPGVPESRLLEIHRRRRGMEIAIPMPPPPPPPPGMKFEICSVSYCRVSSTADGEREFSLDIPRRPR